MPVKVDDPTNIQGAYENLADPTARALQEAESQANDPNYIDKGLKEAEDYANSASTADKVAEKENKSASDARWADNTTKGNGNLLNNQAGGSKKLLNMIKRSGPTAGIAGGLLAAIMTISSILSPAALLNHLTAGFVDKFDTRGTVATIRTNKLLVTKMVGDSTSGSCSYVKLMCRYKKPSSTFLKKLSKAGVEAVDSSGNVIKTNKIFPNQRPAGYRYTPSGSSTPRIIAAAEFSSALQNDVEFRKSFHTAYNPRWRNFADSVFRGVLSRFGTHKGDKTGTAKDKEDTHKKLNEASLADDADSESDGRGRVDRFIREKLEKIVGKLGKSTKGNAAIAVPGLVCTAMNVPGVISGTVRAYQMTQLVRYAMVFLTAADKIKAGNASPTEISALGSILTTVTKDSDGNVTNRAATDSFGVKYALFGDTDTSQNKKDFKKFAPGGNVVAGLSNVTQFTEQKAVDDTCGVVLNPLTGLTVTGGLVATGAAAPIALVLAAAGVAVGSALEAAAPAIISAVMPLIQPHIDEILAFMLGDLTQDLEGEDVGNALASGSAHTMGQMASASGLVPLSVSQALVFDDTMEDVALAYSEEDRVGRSPFDVSSPNTFLGSISKQFLPYASSVSSASGVLSSIASISLGSIKSLVSPAVKAADESDAQYYMCEDNLINDGTLATGPFCNVTYGVPVEYLNTDPADVVQYMLDHGQIDSDTGEPLPESKLEIWMGNCLDGDTDQARSCTIDSFPADQQDEYMYYSLYTIDHQIQKNMDGEDVVEGTVTNQLPTGSCPTGTNRVDEIATGWDRSGNEQAVTLCAIPNTSAEINPTWTDARYKGTSSLEIDNIVVNSEAAANLLAAAQAYSSANSGAKLSASVGYRSVYEQCSFFVGGKNSVSSSQTAHYRKYCQPNLDWLKSPTGNWTTSVVMSNHMMGYSIDFGDASESWMRRCVADSTDGKADNRCFGFYDDVNQACQNTPGCTFYDRAHFTYSPRGS